MGKMVTRREVDCFLLHFLRRSAPPDMRLGAAARYIIDRYLSIESVVTVDVPSVKILE